MHQTLVRERAFWHKEVVSLDLFRHINNRQCSYFLSHTLLNTGEFKEHRGQELGYDVLQLFICFCMAQAEEHTFQLICQEDNWHQQLHFILCGISFRNTLPWIIRPLYS